MKKLKYQTKFVLYHTCVMLIIILGLVSYFYRKVVREMKEKDLGDFQIITEKTVTQLESLYYNMDRTALQIAANPEIVMQFKKLPQDTSNNYFHEHPVETGDVRKFLESYNFKNDAHARICLYNEHNDFVCTSNRAVTWTGMELFVKNENIEKLQTYFQEDGRYVYYKEPQQDVLACSRSQQEEYFGVVRQIKDYYQKTQNWGYVEVQEAVQKLEEIVANMGEGSWSEMLDENGNVIFSYGKRPEGKQSTAFYEISVALRNAPYMVKFYKEPVAFKKALNQFYLVLVMAVVMVLIVAFVLERMLAKHLSKPLVELNRSVKTITMDNLHVDVVDKDSEDIVIQLVDSFNTMMDQLNKSMKNQIEAKENEAKSHFFALQSQMNPHFLHNILAIISMESQLDGNTKIPDICQKLGTMLRYISQMGDGYSTIERECNHAEDYMLLMKVRYENLFQYEIELEEGMKNIQIPKLILQPVCENSFQHGFKNTPPIWKISIHGWMENNMWFVKIEDNGSGFTEEFIKEFEEAQEPVDLENVKCVLKSGKIGGLCIPNIYARMKLFYGESYICKFYNGAHGAVVLYGGKINDSCSGSGR